MVKRKHILPLIILLLASTSLAGNMEKTNITLQMEEEVEVGEYVIEYYQASHVDNEQRLKIGYDTGTTLQVLENLRGENLFEMEGETLNVSEEIGIKINELGNSRDGLYINLNVRSEEDVLSSAQMELDTPSSINVGQGEDTTIPIKLSNNGLTNQTFQLNASESDTVQTVFRNDGFTVSEVFVEAGETETVDADISISQQAEPETRIMEFQAENSSSLTETVNIEVDGAERHESMNLNIGDRFIRAEPGETIATSLRVRNNGEVTLNNVEIDIEGPEDWEPDMQPEGVDTIGPFESENIDIDIDLPANADIGDEFVEISATSDEYTPEEAEEVRINVTEESNMSIVGLALMAFSLIMLLAVYRKFGRR